MNDDIVGDVVATIDGVDYVELPQGDSSCAGCAGQGNSALCWELPQCAFPPVVFIAKEKV